MNLQVIKNRIRKTLVYTFAGILFLVITAFLILQMPPVQNAIVGRLLRNFSHVSGFDTRIESFSLLWFDYLELGGVTITDPMNNQMVYAKTIHINFDITELLNQHDINIDGIILDSARVLLTPLHQSDSSRDLNINIFISELNKLSKAEGNGKKNPDINIGEAVLHQSLFTYLDPERDSIRQGFDYHHFSLDVDEGQLRNFQVIGDTAQFDVATLLVQDRETGFRINELKTFFRISQNSMEFNGLDLRAGQSHITDTVVFSFESQRALQHFINDVQLHAHLDNTIIHPRDLALFAPGAEKIGQPVTLSGDMNGRISKFTLDNMNVAFGRTQLRGSLEMDGLPEINETFIFLSLANATLNFNDFDFLIAPAALKRLEPMGQLFLNGQFLGYTTDFVANGDIVSDLGRIKSDINFKVNEKDFDLSSYKGRLTMTDFNLGKYLQDTTSFQRISLDGNVRGAGLTKTTMNVVLNGKINSVGIQGYNYTRIKTNARFTNDFFSGKMSIDDPNLKFTAEGSVDLREERHLIKIQASLDTANLQALKLTNKKIFLQTQLDIDVTGLQLDSLSGSASFRDFRIGYEDRWMDLEHMRLRSRRRRNSRAVDLETSLVDAHIEGNYYFSNLATDVTQLLEEISMNLENDEATIALYYRQKKRKPTNYSASFELAVKDVKPISELLALDFSLSKNTRVNGSFTSGYTTIFRAYTHIDSVQYGKTSMVNTEAEITTSKIADSTNVLAMAYLLSEKQSLNDGLQTKDLIAEGIWNKNHIDFSVDCDQETQNNYIRLKGAIDFMKDSTRLKLLPSMIHLLDRNWHVEPSNEIVGNRREWNFRNLELMNRDQSVKVNGWISDDPEQTMRFQVNNLDLSILNIIPGKTFTGTANADINLKNYYVNPAIQNDILIKDLTINDFLVGDITGKNLWNSTDKKFDVNFFIDREDTRIVNLQGNYTPSHKAQPLDLTAYLDNANLKILEPFLQELFSDMGGTVSGDFTIIGTLQDPQINGDGHIHNGQLTVEYTKTPYRFTGIVGLRPNAIVFRDIEITDNYKNKAQFRGSIAHHNFYSMVVDLHADFKNFQVLNTTAHDNTLFYGQGYATGDVHFTGPVDNLAITSNAHTEKNTRIFIPIGSMSSSEKKEFINFTNLNDTTVTAQINAKAEDDNKIHITGVSFDLNLDVTPDAYCEIIFDIKAGDIIRGRGNGDLKLQLDTKGEFNMFGTVAFSEGAYNFTLYDLINKEFEIQKNSQITWYGDPYNATLNIRATYNQLASFAPIVNDESLTNTPELRRKYPTQVLLKLDGPMASPQITFDILAPDLPQSLTVGGGLVRLDFLFETFKSKLDEQGLKRQVFSLIVLRKFAPADAFNTSGTIYNSVSELLSNQLSYWMSQVDENLEIDVDLGTMDEEAFNAFQLRLSYTFLNGRLRITRDGTFGNTDYNDPSVTTRNNNLASVAGDWTVDYFLTADGKFKVKMYNRTNYNQLSTSLNNQSYFTTGVSLQHVQSFNELKDLLRFNRKKNKSEEQTPPPAPVPVDINKEARKEEEEGG